MGYLTKHWWSTFSSLWANIRRTSSFKASIWFTMPKYISWNRTVRDTSLRSQRELHSLILSRSLISPGSTVRRGVHSNGQRGVGVRVRVAAAPPVHDLRQEAALHRSVPMQRRRYESGIDRCGNTAVNHTSAITRYVNHTSPRDTDTSASGRAGVCAGISRATAAATTVGHSHSGAGAGSPGAGRPGAGGPGPSGPGTGGYQESRFLADGSCVQSALYLDQSYLAYLSRDKQVLGTRCAESGSGPDIRLRGDTPGSRGSGRRASPPSRRGCCAARDPGGAILALQSSPASHPHLAGADATRTVAACYYANRAVEPRRVDGLEANMGKRISRGCGR